MQTVFEKYTNRLRIQHDDGSIAEYVHLGKDQVSVNKGDTIEKGQELAKTGLSGFMDKPHLHFNVIQVKEDGKELSIPVIFEIGLVRDRVTDVLI